MPDNAATKKRNTFDFVISNDLEARMTKYHEITGAPRSEIIRRALHKFLPPLEKLNKLNSDCLLEID
jgi:hypothetical protein